MKSSSVLTDEAGHAEAGVRWPDSIAVIGAAGLVGSSVVYQLGLEGIGRIVHMVDVKENLSRAHALDIAEAQALAGVSGPELHVVPASEVSEVGSVDLVILAASAPEIPGGDRREFLAANLQLLGVLAPAVQALVGSAGVVLVLSNPVDVMADCLHRMTDIEPQRILGYSLNDSVRFQLAVARELQVMPEQVEALVLGEHGGGQVLMFSRLRVDGQPVELSELQQTRIRSDVDGWFARWSGLEPGRSTGWTTSFGTMSTIRSMGSGGLFPAAAWTGGLSRMPETFVALPVRCLNGTVAVQPWEGSAEERKEILDAAVSVRSAADTGLRGHRTVS